MSKKISPEKSSPVALKKRPRYDPLIENLNDKAREISEKRKKASELGASKIESESQSPEGRSQGIIDHAKRIAGKNQKFKAAFSVYIYETAALGASKNYEILCLAPGNCSEQVAALAIRALTRHALRDYGKEPSTTLDPVIRAENSLKKGT